MDQVVLEQKFFCNSWCVPLYRPFLLMVREPIITLIALYLTVIYIIFLAFLNGRLSFPPRRTALLKVSLICPLSASVPDYVSQAASTL